MTKLTGEQIEQLQQALLGAFTPDDLREFLRTRLEKDLSQISMGGNLRTVVFDVITEAERKGWTAKLLIAVAQSLPDKREVQELVSELLARVQGNGTPIGAKPPAADVSEDTEAKVISPVIRPEPLHIAEPFPMDLMRVPAGPFLMGSDKRKDGDADDSDKRRDRDAGDNETPQHPVEVAEYYIGKYEVTNEQYAIFVTATGHAAPDDWQAGQVPAGLERHPVVRVSWYDALAFTEWLSAHTGRTFRLPTEAQWEKAARGTDGCIYPWGDVPGPLRANFANIEGHATRVGSYSPSGDSPYGAADMIGNVYEWTTSLLVDYPYDSEDGRENLTSQKPRVMRGVSFHSAQRDARCAYRRDYPSDSGDQGIGFRVVLYP